MTQRDAVLPKPWTLKDAADAIDEYVAEMTELRDKAAWAAHLLRTQADGVTVE
jgi:hypothetical protein